MARDRWQRVEELFCGALEMPGEARTAFLIRACGDDRELLLEVRELLSAHDAAEGEETEDFLEAAVDGEVDRLVAGRDGQPEGRRIGAYRILRTLGEGGMSTVYLATRADREFRQWVAVKVIKRGLDSDEIQHRFQRERQILASSSHPNIARLLDGGTTEDGRPYFVLEFIDGQPIDRYCDEHQLSIRDRLALFRTVCAAVQDAHRHLVVHRDLKPSNILVTDRGVPKLLDFGIAKLLAPERFPQTVVPTAGTMRIMTPDYASPEQVRGERITTASDVYALGILLYELLTGQRPYRLGGRPPSEIEQVVCETEVTKPSQAVRQTGDAEPDTEGRTTPETLSAARRSQPATLRRRLSGDLDNIVLMALRKEPLRRYASVDQLSEDLRRHLEGLPVRARRDTPGYRLRKFVGRHRAAVAAAALTSVALLAGAVTTSWQARLARTAQVRAEIDRDAAEEVAVFLEELFEAADPEADPGIEVTARELLHRGAQRVAGELEDRPILQARLERVIGRTYRKLGAYDDAEPLLREALERQKELFGDEHPEVADSLDELALLLHLKGDTTVEPLYRQALDLRRRLFGTQHPQTIESLNNLGELLLSRGDLAKAEDLLRQALDSQRNLANPREDLSLAILHNLASVLGDRGKLEAAEALHREALDLRRQRFGDRHPQVAQSFNNLAKVLYLRGDFAAAEPLYRQVLELRRELLGRHPSVAVSLNNLAKVLYVRGQFDEALPLYRETVALKRELLEPGHPSLATSLHGLAQVMHALERWDEAEPLLHEAYALRGKALPADHPAIAESLVGIGELLLDQERALKAEPLLRQALDIRSRRLEATDWRLAEAQSVLGGALVALGEKAEGVTQLKRSAEALDQALGPETTPARRARQRLTDLGAEP